MTKKIKEQTEITSTNTLKSLSISPKTNCTKPNNNLDWNTIVSKNGETRTDHILRHTLPNSNRKSHGVFNGNPINIVNTAWKNRHSVTPISDGMGGNIYNIPYINAGYESGYFNTGIQLNYVTIITMDNNNALITAFPSLGNYHK